MGRPPPRGPLQTGYGPTISWLGWRERLPGVHWAVPDSVKPFVWVPLIVLWFFTLAVRYFPPLRNELDTPVAQRFAMVTGWVALLGALLVLWVL